MIPRKGRIDRCSVCGEEAKMVKNPQGYRICKGCLEKDKKGKNK